MQKNINKFPAVIIIALLLASCGGAAPTEDMDSVMTAAVSTMVASFFGTQTALVTPATSTITQTYTALPTNTFSTPTPGASATLGFFAFNTNTLGTITPTGTQSTATVNPGALAVGCNNLFFIRDVSIPPGTVLQKNQEFTKTWKVQNNGTCDWLYQYILVPISGDTLDSDGTKIQKLVKVNNWTELSVGLTAPDKAGTYTSYWRLSNGQGTFGATLVLSFVVSDPPTAAPAPSITNTSAPLPADTNTSAPLPTETPTETLTP